MKIKESLWILVRIQDKKNRKKLNQILGCFEKYLYAEMYANDCDLEKEEFIIEKIKYLEPIDEDYY